MLAATKTNQSRNTSSTLQWVKNIDRKENCSFIKFDIENFYLLFQMIIFLLTCKLTRPYYFINKLLWIKKTGNENFDVSMGCFFGAEVCELVGSYILSKSAVIIKKEYIGR